MAILQESLGDSFMEIHMIGEIKQELFFKCILMQTPHSGETVLW